MSLDMSVAICTYNRAEMLGGAIDSLCRQALSASRFEIIIVDNGSTDHTADLLVEYQAKYPHHTIHVLIESRQGLGNARNKALAHAKGHYIAYLDDDARVEPHWLAYALHILNELPSAFACLGGPIAPFYTTTKPGWFKDAYESRTWGAEARALQAGESFSGSNMIWRRDIILNLGGFDERVGVKGTELSLGEETRAFLKAWQQLDHPLMQYAPYLVVEHWVPAFKMKVSYRLKRAFTAGQVIVKIGHLQHGRVYLLLGAWKGLFSGPLGAMWRIKRYRFWQNWVTEEGQPILTDLGKILAIFGIYISVRQE